MIKSQKTVFIPIFAKLKFEGYPTAKNNIFTLKSVFIIVNDSYKLN